MKFIKTKKFIKKRRIIDHS